MDHDASHAGHVGQRSGDDGVALDRLQLCLQVGVCGRVAVDGSTGQGPQLLVLEQLADHRLEQLRVSHGIYGIDDIPRRAQLRASDHHPAGFGHESTAALDR